MRRSSVHLGATLALTVACSIGGGLALTPVAHAAGDEATCEGAYPSDQLVLDLQKLEEAIVDQDENTSIKASTAIVGNIACVQQKLPLGFLGRVYRGLAGGYYIAGDKKTSEAWYRSALEVDRDYRYGVEDLPGDHPLRMVYASILQSRENEEPVALDQRAFAFDGEWYLDGRPVKGPVARVGRPHVLQFIGDGDDVRTWVIQGNGFPDEILKDGRNVADAGKKKKDRDRTKFDVEVHQLGQGAVLVDRSQPPEQIPLIVTGGSLLVASVGLTVGSFISKQNFNTVRDSETRLRRSQQTTNRLALGAVAAAALGAGSLTYGIVISEDGRPMGGRIRVRF